MSSAKSVLRKKKRGGGEKKVVLMQLLGFLAESVLIPWIKKPLFKSDSQNEVTVKIPTSLPPPYLF